MNANAVLATHGETTQEILGSGDATNPSLEFQLKQSPLTYTAAANSSGVQSTLQVRVNNLLWSEVPNFLSSAPSDRAYVTIPNSTGGPTVQFGNGIQGSRTPTGQANIQALYRVGIGAAGNLAAGQLTQALDRPQGLQSVTNPGTATGGADPATPAEARRIRAAADADSRPRRLAGGLPELRVEHSGHLAGIGDLDVVRQHARHISHRGRRGRRDLVAYATKWW